MTDGRSVLLTTTYDELTFKEHLAWEPLFSFHVPPVVTSAPNDRCWFYVLNFMFHSDLHQGQQTYKVSFFVVPSSSKRRFPTILASRFDPPSWPGSHIVFAREAQQPFYPRSAGRRPFGPRLAQPPLYSRLKLKRK